MAPRPSLAQLQKQADIAQIEAIERALVSLHLEDFPPAQRIQLADPASPDAAAFTAGRQRTALTGIPWWSRSARRRARDWAAEAGRAEAAAAWAQAVSEHDRQQAAADAEWAALSAGEPVAVMSALENAFEDNQAPAACVDCGIDASGQYATVVIVFGSADLVPERRPAVTPSGKPTLHKRTKAERNALYSVALGSAVLATVKEGLAVAPTLSEIRVVVVRTDPAPSTPDQRLAAIYAARFSRQVVDALDWSNIDPAQALVRARFALLNRRGAAGDIVALDLSDDTDIAVLVNALRPQL